MFAKYEAIKFINFRSTCKLNHIVHVAGPEIGGCVLYLVVLMDVICISWELLLTDVDSFLISVSVFLAIGSIHTV